MPKLPEFANEREEAAYWDTHDSTDVLDETEAVDVVFVDARLAKKQISLRLDPSSIDLIKTIASRKGIGYQTLIRMWITERLHAETAS